MRAGTSAMWATGHKITLQREMKDRLEELKAYQEEDDFLGVDFQGCGHFNVSYQEEPSSDMDSFFGEVSQLLEQLNKLQELSEEINTKQEQVLCSATVGEVSMEKQHLAALKGQFSHQARSIQESLSNMKESNGRAVPWKGCAEGRIKQYQFYAMHRQHTKVMGQHYAWETEYMGRLKEKISRQSQLAGLELCEREVQQLAESPQAPQLVGTDIQALEALHQLALAQERHQHLLVLEGQISELHALFLSLGVMVSLQQSQVERIEYNVLWTQEYVQESSQEVKKALQYERRSHLAAFLSSVLWLCLCCGCLCCASRNLPFIK